MTRPRLPRRQIVRRSERRVIHTADARYRFLVDVLSCGHAVHHRADDPATTGCAPCAEGKPPAFYPGGRLPPVPAGAVEVWP